jgi:hypothetical protein
MKRKLDETDLDQKNDQKKKREEGLQMNETKKKFSNKEIKEKGINFIKECLKNSKFKEISFYSKYKIKN